MKKLTLLLAIICSSATYALAQNTNQEAVRAKMDEWGECRNVVMTLSKGFMAMRDSTEFFQSGLPEGLAGRLNQLAELGEFVNDVVVYERGFRYYGNVPESLKEALAAWQYPVVKLKMSGALWFIADAMGHYQTNM